MDVSTIILTSAACAKHGASVHTDSLLLAWGWTETLRDHLSVEQFIRLWNNLLPDNTLTMSKAKDAIYLCLGRDA